MSSSISQPEAVHELPRRNSMLDRRDRTERLVATLKAGGDRDEIFRELFDLWRQSIHAFFRRNGFSGEDCNDLVQETYIGVFKGIERFRGDSRFETWLFEIARNVRLKVIEHKETIKRKAEEISLDSLMVVPLTEVAGLGGSAVSNPEDELLDKDRRELVRDEVEKMPDQMRRCYQLWAEGEKYIEISILMSININTVRSHLGAAKARLKDRLGDAPGDADP